MKNRLFPVVLFLSLFCIQTTAYCGMRSYRGYVAAKGLILSENGNPYWVEYDTNGNLIDPEDEDSAGIEIEVAGDFKDSTVISMSEYKYYVEAYVDLVSQNADTIEILTPDEYKDRDFVCLNGEPAVKPELKETSKTVVVQKPEALLTPSYDVVLLEAPINLLTYDGNVGNEEIQTIILDEQGNSVHKSIYNIGYKAGFYTEKDSTDFYKSEGSDTLYGFEDLGGYRSDEHQLWGAVQGTLISTAMGGLSITNPDGYYLTSFEFSNCIYGGGSISTYNPAYAEIRYQTFNPKRLSKQGDLYIAVLPLSVSCSDWSMSNTMNNFSVDIAMLTGQAIITNDLTPVEIDPERTSYAYSPTDYEPALYGNMDFNNDGIADTAVLNDDNTINIWFAGSNTVEDPPDLIRRADTRPDFTHQGLLKSIFYNKESEDNTLNDFRNTDIYLFRVSTGQRICSQEGLNTAHCSVDEESRKMFYRIPVRGPGDNSYFFKQIAYGAFDQWQKQYNFEEEFQKNQADHLRVGEAVKVVMINRATGYMGTGKARIGVDKDNNPTHMLNFSPEEIKLHAPNLKVKAERAYEIDSGLSKTQQGDEPINIIGFEGSGLVSDKWIRLTTEWMDQDGTPLPNDLPGYTGRLAKIVKQNELEEANGNLAHFEIKPGRHTQMIQLPQDGIDMGHYYLQVSGESKEEKANFDPLDENFDILRYRPKTYVPIKVSIYDEEKTSDLKFTRTGLIKACKTECYEGCDIPCLTQCSVDCTGSDNVALCESTCNTHCNETCHLNCDKTCEEQYSEVENQYQWVYRPEMQFSLFDLTIDEDKGIQLVNDTLNTTQSGALVTEDSRLEFVYTLLEGQVPMLEQFGAERELILAVGDNEYTLSVDENNKIQINDSDALKEIDTVELLTLMIYQNGDDENILWEYVFPPLVKAVTRLEQANTLSQIDNPKLFKLARVYSSAQFEDSAGIPPYYDDYVVFPELSLPDNEDKGYASLKLSDESGENEKTLIHKQEISKDGPGNGKFRFLLDYETVNNAGLGINPGDRFKVVLEMTPEDEGYTRTMNFACELELKQEGHMLGQIMAHDVLIQNGSLNLSREDFSLKGRGPSLDFSRSYNNLAMTRGIHPMGAGWGHSFDKRLTISTVGGHNGLPLPYWVTQIRNRFFTTSEIEQDLAWSYANVNGTAFINTGSGWFAERGRHGTLTEDPTNYIFQAKDGTKYYYEKTYFSPVSSFQTEFPSTGSMQQQVSKIVDRNGNTLVFEYENAWLKSVSIQDEDDPRKLDFSYQYIGGLIRLEKVTGPGGIDVTYTYYDDSGQKNYGLLKSASRAGRTETYEYSPDGVMSYENNLVKTTDSNGHSRRYTYYAKGEIPEGNANLFLKPDNVVKTVIYPADPEEPEPFAEFFYTTTDNQRTVKDLKGIATIYTLNNYGNPLTIAEPLGKTTGMTWSINQSKPDNVMTSKTVSKTVNGNDTTVTTVYEYDNKGNVTSETTGPHVITTLWNDFSQPTYKKDITGVEQFWDYYPDGTGNLKEYKDGNGNIFNYEYTEHGEVQTSSIPSFGTTEYTYDAQGNPATVKKPLVPAEVYVYDIRGRLLSSKDPKGFETTYTYDDLDYPDITTYPVITPEDGTTHLTHIVDKDYDAEGNLLKENDRNGLVLSYLYTPRNQVKKITRSMGGVKDFSYDPNGNLLSETDWKGRPTTHHYTDLNQRDTTTNRMNITMSMAYDAGGNLASQTDYEGRTTSYQYDILDRPTWETVVKDNTEVAKTTRSYAIEILDSINGYVETQVVDVTGSRDIETKLLYDGQGNVIRRKVSNDYLHKWQYGPLKNLEWEEDEEGRRVTFSYDEAGRLEHTTRPYSGLNGSHAFITDYGYDDNGNRTSETIHNVTGIIETTTDHDAWNRPVAVHLTDSHDGTPYATRTCYDGMGNVVKTVDPKNIARIQERDALGRLTRTEDGEGKITRYTDYDLNSNLLSMTVDGIVTVENTYDDNDRLKHTTETDLIKGGTREKGDFLYDTMGNLTQSTDYKGNTFKTDYNGLYLPWKVYSANSNTIYTQTGYTKTGWATSVTDRRGMTTTYEYDDFGRVTEQLPPLYARPLVTTYDKVGNVMTITDRRDIETVNTYDSFNRLETVTRSGLLITSTTYDDLGNPLTVTDAKDHTTAYQYNDRNLLVKTLYPLTLSDGSHTEVSEIRQYDGNGNLTQFTDKDEHLTTTTYDNENRPLTVTFANETTTHGYDMAGNLNSVTRPKGNKRTMEYDGFGRLVKVIDDPDTLNLATRYLYDDNNNLEHTYAQKDNSGGESHVAYAYDDQNRKISHTQSHSDGPDLVTTFDEYDNEGNLKQMTDPMGHHVSYDYDDLGRQTHVYFPTTGSPYYETTQVETAYDENNNVTQITETKTGAAGSITDITDNTEYDDFDRLKTTVQRGKTLQYDYDDNGNRTLVSSAAGSTTYTYDARNRLETAVQGTDTTTYTYYRDGKKDTVTYPNGTRATTAYYPTNRVQTITNTLLADSSLISSFSYTYDVNGNRLQQIEVQGTVSETTGYGYDTLDRMTDYTLTDSTGNVTQTVYTFEAYNRKTETVTKDSLVTKSRTYDYNDVNWLTQIVDDTDTANSFTIDYAYDNNGNTVLKSDSSLTDQDTTFTYDSRNQLVRTTRGPPATPEILGLYDYNASGLRVRHRNSERGNVDYYYDGPAVLEERNADDDSLLAHYRYADRLLSLDTGSEIQYYHHDALGSTVNLTNGDGSVRMRYWLDPYGQIRKQEGDSTVNRMVFTGQEHDEKTGLVYFGARYYDPDIARFITQDSYLGESGVPPSLHRYLYAYSNPTVYVDLYGFSNVIGYIYDIRMKQNGEYIRYIGQAKDLKQRLSASGHKWKEVIRHTDTSIESTAVHGDLDVKNANSKTIRGARQEALGSVEQRMINSARRQQKTHGVVQNTATAAMPENVKPFSKRHNVKVGDKPMTIKKAGEPYSRKQIGKMQHKLTVESEDGMKNKVKKGIKKIGGAVDIYDTVKTALDYTSSQKYKEAPYILHDDDGAFKLIRKEHRLSNFDEYEKQYIDENGKELKTEGIDKKAFGFLKEEAEDAYGKKINFGQDWEPGLLRPELEEKEVDPIKNNPILMKSQDNEA